MRLAAFFLFVCAICVAQQNPTPATSSSVPADLTALVQKQFGDDFQIATQKSAGTGFKYRIAKEEKWTPFLVADLDGDGVEDAVIVARSKSPMSGETEFHYKVIDPFFTAYGYGDPKITTTLASEDPDNRNLLLVIHGAGPQAWRAENPKAKFVMVNLPIENIVARKTTYKKHVIAAIDPQSAESNGAMVVWDGKKYRWVEANGK
jgi:hypothetical protein